MRKKKLYYEKIRGYKCDNLLGEYKTLIKEIKALLYKLAQ